MGETAMKKKLFGAIFAIVSAAALTFVFAACEYAVADDQLSGSWVAENGIRLQFSQGRFTRTLNNNSVESGTYTASDGMLTYYRHGFSPETQSYTFSFPKLIIGTVNFYYNALVEPEDIAGFWTPLYSVFGGGATSLIFTKGESQKENPLIKEGNFIQPFYSKGKYVIHKGHLPHSTVLTTTTTHMHGTDLGGFLENQLVFPNLLELFDMSVFQNPPMIDRSDWWFSEAEILRVFEDAATRTRTLEEEYQIMAAREFYLLGRIGTATYSLTMENDPDLEYEMEYVVKTGLNKLSLREGNDPFGMVSIWTFAKSTLTYGE
jgi:hypothetical protein